MVCVLVCRHRWTLRRCLYLIITYIGCDERKKCLIYGTFNYGYMASHITVRTIQRAKEEADFAISWAIFPTICKESFICTSHIQDRTHHGLWYTSSGTLAGKRNIYSVLHCSIVYCSVVYCSVLQCSVL